MRKVLATVFVGLAITSIGMFGADNSLGTWKLNIAKSKSPPNPNPVKTFTEVHVASEGGMIVTITEQRREGAPINASLSVKYDGKDHPVPGAARWDTASMKQVDANTFTFERKKTGGKYHVKGRTLISKDGQTMTTTIKGTNTDGKPVKSTLIYDKQ